MVFANLPKKVKQIFKIIHGINNVSPDTWFRRVDSTVCCADPLNLRLQTSRLETRRNFFSTRVVEAWNAIPSEIKNSKNVHMFKKAYRTHRVNMVGAAI
jgi:hypothetical protein